MRRDGGEQAEREQVGTGVLPTMSFRVCSVMGMGLAASGETNLVKMVTASFSIPEERNHVVTAAASAFSFHYSENSVFRSLFMSLSETSLAVLLVLKGVPVLEDGRLAGASV